MMLDKKLLFCEAKEIAATGNTDTLDLGQACVEEPLKLFLAIPKGATGSGSIQLAIYTGDTESANTQIGNYVLSNAMLTKGGMYVFGLPKLERYAYLKFNLANTLTGLKITAGLAQDVQTAV